MTENDQAARGMRLAAERPEVMPDQADERIRPVYQDVQRTLRVPFVNLIFRTLANDPDYLVPAWEQLSPVLRTRAFERAADEIRAEALLEPVPDGSGVEWEDTGPLEKIRAFNDTIHYVLPKLLLIATAWDEGAWGGGGGDRSEIPVGIAEGTDKAPMVSSEDAPERVRRLLEREKRAHGHPLVSSYYRVLGNWPDFLEAAWTRIEPVVGSTGYRERTDALARLATEAVRSLPVVGEVRGAERTPEVSDLLRAFRREFIPSMMADVALIKALVDGEAAARRSRFSVAARAV
ncbi:MAG TPA: halocarboxylic acid dehydrogenase DehI family protein [Longimicrobiaceae bacterium]|nr:halocarboxylic acid dehydrogenase DehI family protein [Longimicrobiaceae bacterium]